MVTWVFQARTERVVDGDTIEAIFDLGFRTSRTGSIRLAGVDTAEVWGVKKDSEEYEKGKKHSEFTGHWLQTAKEQHDGDWPLEIETRKTTGKYGRYVGIVKRKCDGAVLNGDLCEEFPEVRD